jgi:hypothetical protein
MRAMPISFIYFLKCIVFVHRARAPSATAQASRGADVLPTCSGAERGAQLKLPPPPQPRRRRKRRKFTVFMSVQGLGLLFQSFQRRFLIIII